MLIIKISFIKFHPNYWGIYLIFNQFNNLVNNIMLIYIFNHYWPTNFLNISVSIANIDILEEVEQYGQLLKYIKIHYCPTKNRTLIFMIVPVGHEIANAKFLWYFMMLIFRIYHNDPYKSVSNLSFSQKLPPYYLFHM